jgi:hypothetical protein
MKPFTQFCQIEQFAETPRNHVVGEFRCLLWDTEFRADKSSKVTLWRVAHAPNSGRHPYAVGKCYEHVSL